MVCVCGSLAEVRLVGQSSGGGLGILPEVEVESDIRSKMKIRPYLLIAEV